MPEQQPQQRDIRMTSERQREREREHARAGSRCIRLLRPLVFRLSCASDEWEREEKGFRKRREEKRGTAAQFPAERDRRMGEREETR